MNQKFHILSATIRFSPTTVAKKNIINNTKYLNNHIMNLNIYQITLKLLKGFITQMTKARTKVIHRNLNTKIYIIKF